jgi:carboxymethylenebutenolidase
MQATDERWDSIESGGDLPMRVFVSAPREEAPCASLLVIHEAFGIDEWVQSITSRFAGEGFVAVAPDLFSVDSFGKTVKPDEVKEIFALRSRLPSDRRGDAGALEEELSKLPPARAGRLGEVMEWSSRRDMGALVPHIERALTWSRGLEGATGKVGMVGFCFGGGMTLRAVAEGLELDAAAPFYGANPPLEKVGSVICPLLLMYGRNDPYIMPQVPALLEAILTANLRFVRHVYEEAGHAFLNDQRPEMYSEGASKDAWRKTIVFFKTHVSEPNSD